MMFMPRGICRSARIFPRPIHIIVNPATMDARNSWRCVRVEET